MADERCSQCGRAAPELNRPVCITCEVLGGRRAVFCGHQSPRPRAHATIHPTLRSWHVSTEAMAPTMTARPSSSRPPAEQAVARSSRALALALTVAAVLAPGQARANGALPATIQALLPPDAPGTTIVATTFGLITSIDGGARWRWTCEHALGDQGSAYQLAAPPAVRSSS